MASRKKEKPVIQKRRGQEGKFDSWITPEKLLLIQGWKRNGLSNIEVANNIGISERTLYKWRQESSQLRQVLKVGKDEANFIIENALFNKARSGNTTAMIYWLKNNWRSKYYETAPKQEQETSSKTEAMLGNVLDKLVDTARETHSQGDSYD